MADDNETEFEEEFDFESEEDLLESAEEEFGEGDTDYGGGGGGSNLPPLPVLIGGGAVGLIIIIIIVVMMSGGDDDKVAPPPPAPEPIVQELPTEQPAPIVEEDPWATTSDPFSEDNTPAITPKTVVERIEAQEEAINKQIRALEMKMNELLSKLSRLDQAVGASSRDIEDISLKLEALNQELKMMAAPAPAPAQEEEVEQASEAFTNPTLTVHAIIPGRAWLKTRDGRTITVTEGDPVEGYGKVLAIDAPSGVVITSSGVILR